MLPGKLVAQRFRMFLLSFFAFTLFLSRSNAKSGQLSVLHIYEAFVISFNSFVFFFLFKNINSMIADMNHIFQLLLLDRLVQIVMH